MNPATSALLTPSSAFKKEAFRSVAAIVLFLVVYLLLVAAALAFFALCVLGGVTIITLKVHWITLLLGLGLMVAGLMVFVFMVKFLFSSSKEDLSRSVQITANDHPLLFDMIADVAKQTGTRQPKKVFLSSDVNAAVFYNSSFWSMFLPVRKNLKIGLGLVNSVNAAELKAVVAHEFGHFSQRSMKVGSWVYQVNHILYNLLFENKSYAESLQTIANVHSFFYFFASLTAEVVKAIQWVLRQMFQVVNKSYMGLSRQMEFHADLVAATVAGSGNMVQALRRVEFGEACYQATINSCVEALNHKKTITNFYLAHTRLIGRIAHLNQIELHQGLPDVPASFGEAGRRVQVKDQWASHPTLLEREEHLSNFALPAYEDSRSAWAYFSDAPLWQQNLTEQIYAAVPPEEREGQINPETLTEQFDERIGQSSLPKLFGGYYDNREVAAFDPQHVAEQPVSVVPFAEWFTEQKMLLPRKLRQLDEDIATLQAIIDKQIDTRSFDFDGAKYEAVRAAEVKALLDAEKEQLEKELTDSDEQLFRQAYAQAPLPQAEALRQEWAAYFALRTERDKLWQVVQSMMEPLAPIYRGETLAFETINRLIDALKADHEGKFKKEIEHWLAKELPCTQEAKGKMQHFLSIDALYFYNNEFLETELADLDTVVQQVTSMAADAVFNRFRLLLNLQAGYLHKQAEPDIAVTAS